MKGFIQNGIFQYGLFQSGFFRKAVAGLCLGTGLASLSGCYTYRQLVDPCYPQRYEAVSRHTVYETFNTQAANGHILDQTVWNYYFEKDEAGNATARLNPMGQERLKYLIRRRPAPDGRVFLQTANDIVVDQKDLDGFVNARKDLDNRRATAVQAYLGALMAGRAVPMQFEVIVHDPGEVGINSLPIAGARTPAPQGALGSLYSSFTGQAATGTNIGGLGGAGGGGGGGATGGGTTGGTAGGGTAGGGY